MYVCMSIFIYKYIHTHVCIHAFNFFCIIHYIFTFADIFTYLHIHILFMCSFIHSFLIPCAKGSQDGAHTAWMRSKACHLSCTPTGPTSDRLLSPSAYTTNARWSKKLMGHPERPSGNGPQRNCRQHRSCGSAPMWTHAQNTKHITITPHLDGGYSLAELGMWTLQFG